MRNNEDIKNGGLSPEEASRRAYVETVRQRLADGGLTVQERCQIGRSLERICKGQGTNNEIDIPATLWTDAELLKAVDSIQSYYMRKENMVNDEELNFKKVMQKQISQKAKPIAKQYGLKPGKRNAFVMERDNLVFHWVFGFDRTSVVDRFEIVPIYAPIKGGFGDGLPLHELFEWARISLPYVACSTLNYFASESEKQEVIKKFDTRLTYNANKLHYCEEMDSFEKYIAQVHRNIAEMPQNPFPLKLDDCGKYILGIYDCMQRRYDEGREKVKQALDEYRERASEKELQWLSELTLDDIGSNNSHVVALYYKFMELFVQALDKPLSEREECFKKTYEIVCNKMRKFYGIKVS